MHNGIDIGSWCMASRSAKQWVNVKLLANEWAIRSLILGLRGVVVL